MEAPPAQSNDAASGGWSFRRVMLVSTGFLIAPVAILFVVGVILALIGDPAQTALRLQMIRDIVVIALALEGILIVLALVVLIIQVARLVNLLRGGITPILQNTRDTVDSTKETVEFVGQNVREPIILAGRFFSGLRVFLRDSIAVWRILRPRAEEQAVESVVDQEPPSSNL